MGGTLMAAGIMDGWCTEDSGWDGIIQEWWVVGRCWVDGG